MKPPKQAECCQSCGAPIPALRWRGLRALDALRQTHLAECEYCREPLPMSALHWAAEDATQILLDTAPLSRWVSPDPACGALLFVNGVRVGNHG